MSTHDTQIYRFFYLSYVCISPNFDSTASNNQETAGPNSNTGQQINLEYQIQIELNCLIFRQALTFWLLLWNWCRKPSWVPSLDSINMECWWDDVLQAQGHNQEHISKANYRPQARNRKSLRISMGSLSNFRKQNLSTSSVAQSLKTRVAVHFCLRSRRSPS